MGEGAGVRHRSGRRCHHGALLLVLVSWPFNTSSLRYTADGAPLLLPRSRGVAHGPLPNAPGREGHGGRRLTGHGWSHLRWGIAATAAVQVLHVGGRPRDTRPMSDASP